MSTPAVVNALIHSTLANIRAVVATTLVIAILPFGATTVRASSPDVVLHDCNLVFRFGSDQRYGVDLVGSEARAINNLGEIVGWARTPDGNIHAMRWRGGAPEDMGTLGGPNSCALGVNDAGQAVGWAETETGERHAVRWDRGDPVDLGSLPGEYSVAFAINESGQAVGLSWPVDPELAFPIGRAMLWDRRDMIDLSAGRDVAGSGAYDINDSGEIVGWVVPIAGRIQAARWSANDTPGTPPLSVARWSRSVAFATDEAGRVVGWTELSGSEAGRRSVVWVDGEPTALRTWSFGDVPVVWGEASDINRNGVIAGAFRDLNGGLGGAIWYSATGALVPLGTLGGTKSEAYAVNDLDQVVGWSLTAAGTPGAFLWQDGNIVALPNGERN